MRPSTSSQLTELSIRLNALAQFLGLNPPGAGAARGQRFGAELRMEIRMRKEIILRVRIPASLPTGLQIDSEQEVAASRRSVGFQDIQVGTKAFDDCVHVRALNPAAAIRLLRDEELLRRLPLLLTAHPRARLAGDELIIPLPAELSAEQVRDVVKEAAELAVEFGRAGAAEAERGQRTRSEARGSAPIAASAPGNPSAPVQAGQGSGAQARGPRPGAGVVREEKEESGRAYLNRIRRSVRRRRWWTIGLRVGAIPVSFFLFVKYRHYEWTELLTMLGAIAAVVVSTWIWRCPACDGPLDKTPDSPGGGMSVHSCPHCSISLSSDA
jgi:hypothetical protein